MDMIGNTILITGGGSGIGRGLAEAFHAVGNQVIVAGRRPGPLAEVVAANPGMTSVVLDVADTAAIRAFAERVAYDHPGLNVLVNNAGIMKAEDPLANPFDLSDCEATITANLLGPIRLTAALLPQLRRQPAAAVVNVTSPDERVSDLLSSTNEEVGRRRPLGQSDLDGVGAIATGGSYTVSVRCDEPRNSPWSRGVSAYVDGRQVTIVVQGWRDTGHANAKLLGVGAGLMTRFVVARKIFGRTVDGDDLRARLGFGNQFHGALGANAPSNESSSAQVGLRAKIVEADAASLVSAPPGMIVEEEILHWPEVILPPDWPPGGAIGSFPLASGPAIDVMVRVTGEMRPLANATVRLSAQGPSGHLEFRGLTDGGGSCTFSRAYRPRAINGVRVPDRRLLAHAGSR